MMKNFREFVAVAMLSLLFLGLPAQAPAYWVRFDYTASAEQFVGFEYLTDSDYLYDQTYIEGHHTQLGYSEAGNYASLGYVADISTGTVGAHTIAVGVHTGGYSYYLATARVEHVGFHDELTFLVPAGSYPEGLYAQIHGRCAGLYSSEVGAGAQISCMASFGSNGIYDTGILAVGGEESGTRGIDETFTLTTTLVYPGQTLPVDYEVDKSVSAAMHRCLNWAVEYNTGAGYVTGSGWNDFCGGLQLTELIVPAGVSWWSASGVFLGGAVAAPEGAQAAKPVLLQNHPNPFNPMTTLAFELPEDAVASLRVFGVDGRLLRTLREKMHLDAGRHELVWNGRDDYGRAVPGGVYLYRLETDRFSEARRMILLK
jgi:hypothetical protein